MSTEHQSAVMSGRCGMCIACGAIEAELVEVTGYRNLSHVGESSCYPTGYGCEMCS